jgi:hypothetical protein
VIVARLSRSSSFERRIAYLFRHGHAVFSATQQLVSPAPSAAIEMNATWHNQLRLKEAAGIRRGGRACTSPVAHDVMSWGPDERPGLDEMERAARSYLTAIGLGEHQAVMVGHRHNGKHHVHIIANTVHPMTGRVADNTNDQRKAQAWAFAYERAQGRERCKHRSAPKMDRAFTFAATGKKKPGQRLSRVEFERKRKRQKADAQARSRYNADAWARLMAQQAAASTNITRTQESRKAGNLPAPRP